MHTAGEFGREADCIVAHGVQAVVQAEVHVAHSRHRVARTQLPLVLTQGAVQPGELLGDAVPVTESAHTGRAQGLKMDNQ